MVTGTGLLRFGWRRVVRGRVDGHANDYANVGEHSISWFLPTVKVIGDFVV